MESRHPGTGAQLWQKFGAAGYTVIADVARPRYSIYCWRSRQQAYISLMALRRRCPLPQPASKLILRCLLRPCVSLATWTEGVVLSPGGHEAVCRSAARFPRSQASSDHGCLVFSAQPLAATPQGRYTEVLVTKLGGDLRCGLVMGVTQVKPGSWPHGVPVCVQAVPGCMWGLPRCRAPRIRLGTRLGYLVTWRGDLVLFVDGAELGRCSCPQLSGDDPLWLVVDLSHDVVGIAIEDADVPQPRPPRLWVEALWWRTAGGRRIPLAAVAAVVAGCLHMVLYLLQRASVSF